jgi:hypothetical protein
VIRYPSLSATGFIGWMVTASLWIPASAAAQEIRGVVRDVATQQPLPGTLVIILDADSVIRATMLSDSVGAFRLSAPAGDTLRLFAQHLGYVPQRSVPILLDRVDALEIVIGLRPDPITLEGVTVTAPVNQNLERFLRNQRRGFGHYLAPEEVAEMGRLPSSQVVLRVPGAFLMPSGIGGVAAVGRPSGMNTAPFCAPHVYVDGWALTRGASIDSYVTAGSVRAVEVYRNPMNAPPEYQRAFMEDCAVILIWTDFGFGFGKHK